MQNYTGSITLYKIEQYPILDKNQRTETPKCDCLEPVYELIVHADLSATLIHVGWEENKACSDECSGGSSGSGGGDYWWTPVWDTGSGGYVEDGDMTGSGGGTSGSGSEPKEAVALISVEEFFAKELERALRADPFLLLEDIPCEELQKWRDLANQEPPQKVNDIIEQMNLLYDPYMPADFHLQSVHDASGQTLNADFFSVEIESLPAGMSPEDLLKEIRLNINNFINPATADFEPFDDEALNIWTSDNPVGAILHIDMGDNHTWAGGFNFIDQPEDGSVICSGYDGISWTFSTINAMSDFAHPVSGNRKFGFLYGDNNSLTFYTRGVDRATTFLDDWVQEDGFLWTDKGDLFKGADELWSSLQENVVAYINQNGGSATVVEPVIARPKYNGKIKQYFEGEIYLDELGCD